MGLQSSAIREGGGSVHSLDHFCFQVPDLDQAAHFFQAFGLDVEHQDRRLMLRAKGQEHVWVRLELGPAKKLQYVCMTLFEHDLDRFRRKLASQLVECIEPPFDVDGEGVWIRNPDAVPYFIKVGNKTAPDAKTIIHSSSSDAGVRGAPLRSDCAKVRPARLAHLLCFTADLEQTISFCEDILGMKASDVPGPVAFLHCRHGSDHHVLAFAQSSGGPGYHHSAWEVASLDEVGLGAMQMEEAGYDVGNWGTGRHVLGSNYFAYIRDPWNSYAEYSFDIDYIPADVDWETGYPSADNSLYLWGPPPPGDFVYNYENAPLDAD